MFFDGKFHVMFMQINFNISKFVCYKLVKVYIFCKIRDLQIFLE